MEATATLVAAASPTRSRRILPPAALELAARVTVGDIGVDVHTVRLLRLILTYIDQLEIAASRGAVA